MTLEEQFEKYVAEDAERWHAVHARIGAFGEAIFALACGVLESGRTSVPTVMRFLHAAEQLALERNDRNEAILVLRHLNLSLEETFEVPAPKFRPKRKGRDVR